MTELVVLTEEVSAKDLLDGLLPKLLPPGWTFRCIPFEGKQDLEKRMGRFLSSWRAPGAKFVVLRDQDSADCRAVKSGLVERCRDAGRTDTLVRIACRDLEAWIAGDLRAFAAEYSVPAAAKAVGVAKFRNPDVLGGALAELQRFAPYYQKRDGARRMGPLLDPMRNSSRSFREFCDGIARVTANQ